MDDRASAATDLAERLRFAARMRGAAGVADTFRVAVDGEAADARVVLAGDIDIAALPSLRAILRALFARRPRSVEIDLAAVDLVETVTAAFLAREQAAARARGTVVVLRGARGVPRRLLAMAGAQVEAPRAPDEARAATSPRV